MAVDIPLFTLPHIYVKSISSKFLPLCSKSLYYTHCCHLCSMTRAASQSLLTCHHDQHSYMYFSCDIWKIVAMAFWSCNISHYTCGISNNYLSVEKRRCSFSSPQQHLFVRLIATFPGQWGGNTIRCFLYCVLWHDLVNDFSRCTACV